MRHTFPNFSRPAKCWIALWNVLERSKTFQKNQMDAPPQSVAFHRARALRAEGKSLRAIAAILEAEGAPLPPGRTTKWSHTAVVRLFRQFDTPPPPAPDPALQRPRTVSPPPPPPPAPMDRDMPPLGGPPWIPKGWKPRLLLALLVVALLGAGVLVLQIRAELRTYHGVWAIMTPEEREEIIQRIQQRRRGGG